MQMGRLPVFLSAALAAASACAIRPADREARVDAGGVMRWADDGSEVAVFGVNYYTPFALDYRILGERGYDRMETIRRDVAHFRRLGLSAIRLHCFDREFSTKEGAFVDNDHVKLLDYLIAHCASNGIYTVLTPIAAWGGGRWTSNTNGFAAAVGMKDLTSRPDLLPAQVRFEDEFARHRNRYTGRRYADDPAVLCFELVNEPAYPDGTTGERIAAYANALLAGIRRSGTRKPVFYSATWNRHNECIPFLKTDGVSGVYYATGLESAHALKGTQLNKVLKSSLAADERLVGKARIVYEFDAADTTGAYMYPAYARLFRSEGAQSATQFQYDSVVLADDNVSYRTHYLNLVYTPAKALSLAIAAEAFRCLPRGTEFVPVDDEMSFPPFHVKASSDLSEMVTETDLLHTATTAAKVPAPERLGRVWGRGSSSVVKSTGNGCYFLDRVATGLWRLQLYPSVMPCADPHTGLEGKKTVLLADRPALTVALPDLGPDFAAFSTEDERPVGSAVKGRIVLAPGDYVLSKSRNPSAKALAAARQADLPRYFAPPADKPDPSLRRWPLTHEELVDDARKSCCGDAGRWNFYDATTAFLSGLRGGWVTMTKDDRGVKACRYDTKNFTGVEASYVHIPVEGDIYAEAFPSAGPGRTLVITGRAAIGDWERVEVAFTLDNKEVWGTVVTLPSHWSDVRVPVESLSYFQHWDGVLPKKAGARADLRHVRKIDLCYGKWLAPDQAGRQHAFELSAIRVEE